MKALVLAVAVAVAVALGAPACSGGGGGHPATPAAPQANADVLAYLPADSQAVLGIDFKQLTASAIFKEYEARIKKALESTTPKAADEACYKHFLTTQSMTLSLQSMEKDAVSGVFVLRVPDAHGLLECFVTDKAADATVKRDGDVVILTGKTDNKVIAATAVGTDTLVAHLGVGANAASVHGLIAAGTPLRKAPAFLGQFKGVDPGATSWLVIGDGSKVLASLSESGIHAHGAYARLAITDQLAVVIHLAVGSADEAKMLAQALDAQATQVRALVGKLDIKADGSALVVDAAMTAEKLRLLVGMLGGGGGGGGD